MEMLKPDSIFTFGLFKGKTVTYVFKTKPSYLCWLRKTGFSNFGKEVTEAVFAWEEMNPREVQRVERSIANSLARIGKTYEPKKEEVKAPKPSPVTANQIKAAQSDPLFGSW